MAKIGIISDTHDNLSAIDKAITVFNSKGVDMIIHAGDWNAPFSLDRFMKAKAKVIGVFGNVNGERDGLIKKGKEIGAKIMGDVAEVDLDGVKVMVIHGKDEEMVLALARSGKYQAIIRGHSHEPGVKRIGATLIINPGEACGYLTGKRTVAIFDTNTFKVEIIAI